MDETLRGREFRMFDLEFVARVAFTDCLSEDPTAVSEVQKGNVFSTWAMDFYTEVRDAMQLGLNIYSLVEQAELAEVYSVRQLARDNLPIAVVSRDANKPRMIQAYGVSVLWDYKVEKSGKITASRTTINFGGNTYKELLELIEMPMAPAITMQTRRVVFEPDYEIIPTNEIRFEGIETTRKRMAKRIGAAAAGATLLAAAAFGVTKLPLPSRKK